MESHEPKFVRVRILEPSRGGRTVGFYSTVRDYCKCVQRASLFAQVLVYWPGLTASDSLSSQLTPAQKSPSFKLVGSKKIAPKSSPGTKFGGDFLIWRHIRIRWEEESWFIGIFHDLDFLFFTRLEIASGSRFFAQSRISRLWRHHHWCDLFLVSKVFFTFLRYFDRFLKRNFPLANTRLVCAT